jgi:transposase
MSLLLETLPECPRLRLDDVVLTPTAAVVLLVSTAATAPCPRCGTPSDRVHSRYRRTVADLPCHDRGFLLRLLVRRFRCIDPGCTQRIFCERLPGFLSAHARSTTRLTGAHCDIGFALGGEAGSRLAERLGLPTSPDTLLRRVQASPDGPAPAPRYVGVDDWAIRKGQRYGTILIDLERGRVLDLVPGRDGEALKAWLKDHPGVEVITRDRWPAYAQASAEGAPQAQQIADRWHLLKNLREAVEQVLARLSLTVREALQEEPAVIAEQLPAQVAGASGECLGAAAAATTPITSGTTTAFVDVGADPASAPPSPREQARQTKRRLRAERHQRVRQLRGEGLSLRQIARATGLSMKCVIRYARAERCPDWSPGQRRPTQLDAYATQVEEWLAGGGRNAAELYRELAARGCRAGYDAVRRCVNRRLGSTGRPGPRTGDVKPAPPAPPSARKLSFEFIRRAEDREASEQARLDKLRGADEGLRAALDLAAEFAAMVRKQAAVPLAEWLTKAEGSGCAELRNFAGGLRLDEAAVAAALTERWSNGPVEGQVNRLKVIATDYPDRHTPSLGGYTTRAALCGSATTGQLARAPAGYLWRNPMSNTRDSRRPPAR